MHITNDWIKVGALFLMLLHVEGSLAQDDVSGKVSAPVVNDTLLVTSCSWNGEALPQYPAGTPKISIMRYTIRPHTKMSVHRHAIISGGYMLEGELTIVSEEGKEMTFKAGDALVETTDTWHYGENRGDKPVVVVMFYAGAKDIPLSERKRPNCCFLGNALSQLFDR